MPGTMSAHRPRCPFCDQFIEAPRELEPRRMGDFEYGTCPCGAVYVCDVTGHNLGAALVEAMGFACNDDWDLAWSLMPDEDYTDARIERYDIRGHLVQPTGRDQEGRAVRGVLTFIRLHRDVRDVTAPGIARRMANQAPAQGSRKGGPPAKGGRRYTKREVEGVVRSGGAAGLQDMALEDPLILQKIQRLLYSPDEGLRWKAVLSLGVAAGAVVRHHPGIVGDTIRRLLHACNDSAATSWGFIEAIGEIIRAEPDIFGSFLRHILAFLRHPTYRPAVLWAAGRIGGRHPDLVKAHAFFAIFDLLKNPEPAVRGYAVWALGQIGAREASGAFERMQGDTGVVRLFDGDTIREVTVGTLAQEALRESREIRLHVKEEPTMSEPGTTTEQEEALVKAAHTYREADLLRARGMAFDAMEKFREALATFEANGKEVEVANICEKLADIYVQRGNFAGAIPLYQRGMAICEKRSDPVSSLILAEKIVDIYREREEWNKALPYYFRSLELCESLGDAGRAGLYLTGIGDIYQRQGILDKALDAYHLALKIYQGMGSRERAGVLERGIADLESRSNPPSQPVG